MDCIFCKIINNEVPCYKIYENENVLAFLDISGDIDGHTLVIPKKHYTNILDCPEEQLEEIIKAVKYISNHYINNCGYEGINILNANNPAAQQSVFHLHFHIIPRHKNDGENAFFKFGGAKHDLTQIQNLLKLK